MSPTGVLTPSPIFDSKARQENVPRSIVCFILVAKLCFCNLSISIRMSHPVTSEMKRWRTRRGNAQH